MIRSLVLLALFAEALLAMGCDDSSAPTPILSKPVPTQHLIAPQPTDSPIPTPSVSSSPQPLFMQVVTALSFSDPLHGWAYGPVGRGDYTPNRYGLRATIDGGQTWSRVFSPSGQEQAWTHGAVSYHEPYKICFANSNDGWIFDPGFLSTHDGGKTWTDESATIDVIALAAVGDTVWRIEHNCCSLHLSISSDDGHTWAEPPTQPALPATDAQLMRTSMSDAWILALSPEWPRGVFTPVTKENQYGGILFVTHDAGYTWKKYGAPDDEFATLDALPDGTLWTLLSSIPSAGNQLKSVYRSVDDGQTWSEVAKSTRDGSLSFQGYAYAFAAASDQAAWILTDNPGRLLQSSDGGYTWSNVPAFLGENHNSSLMFIDSRSGWFSSFNKVSRTTDGGASWSVSTVP
jgi:photosystem II stability/assembly factor-like uncharacterized protein